MKMFNRIIALFFVLLMVAMAGCASGPQKRGAGEYIDDASISTRVKAALAAEPATNALQVNVETYKGVVQLSGFVDSQESINRAVAVTKAVNGVKSVKNSLMLRQAAPRQTAPSQDSSR